MMKLPRTRSLLILSVLLTPATAEDHRSARERLDEMMLTTGDSLDQACELLRIGHLESDMDPEVAALARERLSHYDGALTIVGIRDAFGDAPVELQRRLIDLTAEVYPEIKGSNPNYLAVIRAALLSDDSYIRRAALDQVARYGIRRMALSVVDIYYLRPEDRLLALETAGRLRDRRATSPALEALSSDDAELRDTAIRALARIGRPAAVALKERMLSSQPQVATAAARALLGFADTDDLPALYEFAERFAATDEDLGRRLTRAIAEIEVGSYVAPAPEDL